MVIGMIYGVACRYSQLLPLQADGDGYGSYKMSVWCIIGKSRHGIILVGKSLRFRHAVYSAGGR